MRKRPAARPRGARTGATRRTRLARRLGWDRNPLRRRCDRVETLLITTLVAGFLIAAPLLAVLAGRLTDQAGVREQYRERTWHQVPATLLHPAVTPAGPADNAAWVPARWTTPAGRPRTGLIAVDLSAAREPKVRVWIDGRGHLSSSPLSHQEVIGNTTLAATAAAAVTALLAGTAAGVARVLVNRRRAAAWEQGWRTVGPRWSRRP